MSIQKTTQWNVNATRCAGGGQTLDCNLYATHNADGELKFVEKKLVCGCVLTPDESETT